jgi:superfamily II DNA/RNA helicase
MFSATWPQEVRKLAIEFQKDPVFLNVGSLELSANHNITQVVEVIEEFTKPNRLYQLLEKIMKEVSGLDQEIDSSSSTHFRPSRRR